MASQGLEFLKQLTRPILCTLKIKPRKCWKIFPLRNGCFEKGVGVRNRRPWAVLHEEGGKGRCL